MRRPSGCVARVTIRLATSCTGTRWLALRCRLAARRINGEVSGRSLSFLTSPQRLQVARADTLLPREKRAFSLQRVAFLLRPHGAVAPSGFNESEICPNARVSVSVS
jgi:hypothetical protein